MGTVLVVDDIAANCQLLESMLAPDPDGLRGEAIPLLAQIMTMKDWRRCGTGTAADDSRG